MIFTNEKAKIGIYDQFTSFIAVDLITKAKTAKNVLDKKIFTINTPVASTAALVIQFL